MNTDRRVVLYVGASDRARSMATTLEQRGWYIYGATRAHEALALYTFYWPHVVIVDAGYDGAIAETAYFHLASINAPVLILGDRSDTAGWSTSASAVRHASPSTDVDEIVATVNSLLAERTDQRISSETALALVSEGIVSKL